MTTGAIYAFLNTLGLHVNALEGVFGPVGALASMLRWFKLILLGNVTFLILNFIFAPEETSQFVGAFGFDAFKNLGVTENFSVALIREFIADCFFMTMGFVFMWLWARSEQNESLDLITLGLQVVGLNDPDDSSVSGRRKRALPFNEESIQRGYHDMLKTFVY